jgi:hypothetical protein
MTSPGCGININTGPNPATLRLTGTHFFGNDTDSTGDANIKPNGGHLTIDCLIIS